MSKHEQWTAIGVQSAVDQLPARPRQSFIPNYGPRGTYCDSTALRVWHCPGLRGSYPGARGRRTHGLKPGPSFDALPCCGPSHSLPRSRQTWTAPPRPKDPVDNDCSDFPLTRGVPYRPPPILELRLAWTSAEARTMIDMLG